MKIGEEYHSTFQFYAMFQNLFYENNGVLLRKVKKLFYFPYCQYEAL
jgi:hypothetical protein